jgi:PilZ domain
MEELEDPKSETAQESESREMPWCPVDEDASLLEVGNGTVFPGRMVQLGLSGCRLNLHRRVVLNLPVAVEANFRIRGIAFRLGGIAQWGQGGSTAEVRFGPMSARRRDDLMEVLCEVEAENAASAQEPEIEPAAKASDRAPARDAANAQRAQPALVPGVGRARPQTLPLLGGSRNPASPLGGFGPGSGSGARPDAGPVLVPRPRAGAENSAVDSSNNQSEQGSTQAAGEEAAAPAQTPSERRTDRRSGVETTAVILLVKIGSKLASQVLDLSLGGCRMRTVERFPVGIYTRVEVEFRLQGLCFRLAGVIQAIYGWHEAGIRFLDVSARKREQVAELIEEIEAMRSAAAAKPQPETGDN